jgi:hypothetical protein
MCQDANAENDVEATFGSVMLYVSIDEVHLFARVSTGRLFGYI